MSYIFKDNLKDYINGNLIEEKHSIFKASNKDAMNVNFGSILYEERECSSIDDYIENNKNDNRFQKLLFEYIDERGLKDSDVYNKVNIDRRLFSKIRSNENYHPSKETIILLGISLELNINELQKLLESASYSLPKNNKYDLIIRFCFMEHIYNIDTINEFLYDYGFNTL